tara:strand:- start:7300 stop:7494 length:195 start_codon:yes stop_codon:yes gene_type:complete
MEEENDTIYDQFLFAVDQAIEKGQPNDLRKIIVFYKDKIGDSYIQMAKNMYEELVIENFEDMTI